MASADNDAAHVKQAIDYWGRHLIQSNKLPSEKLERLLRGIAYCISARFPVQNDEDCRDLTPSQLASFYRLMGGNYDPLFCDMPSQSLAVIYKSLGCSHSLQPATPKDGHCAPCTPALKSRGFVKWQTIQIHLGPQEHVPFVQNALQEFNVVDPVDGKPFPRYLPTELFPSQPNREMVEWHNTVGERLRREALEAADQADDSRPSTAEDDTASINSAAHYIATHRQKPHKEDKAKEEKPTLIKQITGAPAKVFSPDNVIGRAARNFIDPNLWNPGRRRSVSERPIPPRDSWVRRDERRDSDYTKDPRREQHGRQGSRPFSSQSPRWSGERERGRSGSGNETGHYTQHNHDRPGSGSRPDGRRRSTASEDSESPPPYRATRQRSVSHDSPHSKRSYYAPSGPRSSDEQQYRRPHDYERRESFARNSSRTRQSGGDVRGASSTRRRHGSNTSNGPEFVSPQWQTPTSAPRMPQSSQFQHPRPQGTSDHPYTSSKQQSSQSQPPPPPPQSNQTAPQRPAPALRNGSYGTSQNIDMQRSQSQQQPPPPTVANGLAGVTGLSGAADPRRSSSMRQSRPSKQLNSAGGESDPSMSKQRNKIHEPRWQPRWDSDQYRPASAAATDVHLLGVPAANEGASLQRRRSAPSPGASPRISPSATTPERRSSGFEVRTPGGTINATDYFGLDSIDSTLSSNNAAGGIPHTRVNGVGGRRYPSGTPWD